MKIQEWQKIATEFNAMSSIHPRDWSVLRNLWENSKKRAKQSQTLRNQHILGTGGGPPKKNIEDPATERVLQLIQTRVTGFLNSYDSDGTLVLASGSNHNTEAGEGTSGGIVIFSASENAEQHKECSNDTNIGGSQQPNDVIEIDWSQYTPSMLREARNPALTRPRSSLADEQVVAKAEEMSNPQLPVAHSQLSLADPPMPMDETQPTNSVQDHRQELNTPLRASTTRVTPAATTAPTTSRRRPVSRREREAQNLTTERINTLLKCNTHAEEKHAIQIKILRLQEQREKLRLQEQQEILEKTQQERVKLENFFKKLNE